VTALMYFLVAVLAVSLSVMAFLEDRQDPARQAFLAFGIALALANVGFSLSLLPGLEIFRGLYLLAGAATAPTALWTFDRAFLREDDRPTRGMMGIYWGTGFVACLAVPLHLFLSDGAPRATPPALILGVYTFYGYSVALRRLWSASEGSNRGRTGSSAPACATCSGSWPQRWC
jgi:hypothetical protein